MEIRLDFEAKENTIYEFKKVLLPEEDIDILKVKNSEENKDYLSFELSCGNRKKILNLKNYTDRMLDQKTVMVKDGLLLLFDKVYPWGAFVGVRPTKLIRRYLIMGYTYDTFTFV